MPDVQKVYYRDWSASRFVPFAYINSRLAAPLSRLLAAQRVDPNAVTFLAAAAGAGAIAAALVGAWGAAALGLGLFLLLDHVDGQVARAQDRRTLLGGYLDTLIDLVVDVLFLAAITAWGVLHDPRLALLGLMALAAYVLLELLNRHGGHTLILEALRSGDFRARDGPPTIRGPVPVVPHRDLNIVVLAAGLALGWLDWALAGLTAWWAAWSIHRVARDLDRPKNTQGVLLDLMHGDAH